MKSPKNVVKAFMLTALTVSPMFAFDENLSRGFEVAKEEAPKLVTPGRLQAMCDGVKAHLTLRNGAIVGGTVAAAVGAKVAYNRGWFGQARDYVTGKVKGAYNAIKNNPWKTAGVVTTVAGLGAVKRFKPEWLSPVTNVCTKENAQALCSAGWNAVKGLPSAAWNHKGKVAATVATAVAVPTLGYFGYRYFKPAAQDVPSNSPTVEEAAAAVEAAVTPVTTTPVAPRRVAPRRVTPTPVAVTPVAPTPVAVTPVTPTQATGMTRDAFDFAGFDANSWRAVRIRAQQGFLKLSSDEKAQLENLKATNINAQIVLNYPITIVG